MPLFPGATRLMPDRPETMASLPSETRRPPVQWVSGGPVPSRLGAKPHLLIDPERWDDSEWITELVRITCSELPLPKPKKAKPA